MPVWSMEDRLVVESWPSWAALKASIWVSCKPPKLVAFSALTCEVVSAPIWPVEKLPSWVAERPPKLVVVSAAIWVEVKPLTWVEALRSPILVGVSALIWVVARLPTWVEEKAPRRRRSDRPAGWW